MTTPLLDDNALLTESGKSFWISNRRTWRARRAASWSSNMKSRSMLLPRRWAPAGAGGAGRKVASRRFSSKGSLPSLISSITSLMACMTYWEPSISSGVARRIFSRGKLLTLARSRTHTRRGAPSCFSTHTTKPGPSQLEWSCRRRCWPRRDGGGSCTYTVMPSWRFSSLGGRDLQFNAFLKASEESTQLKLSTAAARIRSARRSASFTCSSSLIVHFTCPLHNCSKMEVGTAVLRPVTACKGDNPMRLHRRFLALKQLVATNFISSRPSMWWVRMTLIIINLITAPCRSTWPCLHFAPGGTTSCLKSKSRERRCTTSSNSFPPSVWRTSGAPRMPHHLFCSRSAVISAPTCLLTLPVWNSVRPSIKWVTLKRSPFESQMKKESANTFSPNLVGRCADTFGSAPGGRTAWHIWQRSPFTISMIFGLVPLTRSIRTSLSCDGWPSTTCKCARACRILWGPWRASPSKNT